jgi:hypothetical protein
VYPILTLPVLNDVGETPEGQPPNDENRDYIRGAATENTTTGIEIGDLPDYTMSEADRMMDDVYGDHVHQNLGKHDWWRHR